MKILAIALLSVAFVCFVLYSYGWPKLRPVAALGIGLACWVFRELLTLLVTITLLFAGASLLTSCLSTSTGDPAKDGRNNAANQAVIELTKIVGEGAVQGLFAKAVGEKQAGQGDYLSSAAAGVWANVDMQTVGSAVKSVIQAYSAGKTPQTAAAAARVVEAVPPAKRSPTVLNAIAAVISSAATSN